MCGEGPDLAAIFEADTHLLGLCQNIQVSSACNITVLALSCIHSQVTVVMVVVCMCVCVCMPVCMCASMCVCEQFVY